jgi:SAM-dependent methyltransferase
MPVYDEFIDRPLNSRGEKAAYWSNELILKNFLRIATVDPRGIDLLEIGCGRGYIGVAAQKLGFRSFTGVEPNHLLAQYCRNLLGSTIHEDSLPALDSVPDSSFDLVVSAHVLEHATSPLEARKWCAEMSRVLRPGGYVLIVTPDAKDYGAYFWDTDWSHGYPVTPKRATQLLRDVGFDVAFAGKTHLGHTGMGWAVLAHALSFVVPTQVGDRVASRFTGRAMVSELKVNLWGLVVALGTKPRDDAAATVVASDERLR